MAQADSSTSPRVSDGVTFTEVLGLLLTRGLNVERNLTAGFSDNVIENLQRNVDVLFCQN